MEEITSFSGQHSFLSNFYACKIGPFPSLENAYVAAKLKGVHEILLTCTPGQAKRYGRKHELVEEWSNEAFRINTMRVLLKEKFKAGSLRTFLINTGDAKLIEGNAWGDTFWGQSPIGTGHNWLGRLLMEIRSDATGASFF